VRALVILFTFLIGVVLAMLVAGTSRILDRGPRVAPPDAATRVDPITEGRETAIVRAVQRVSDAVVSIAVHVPPARRSSSAPSLAPWEDLFSTLLPTHPEARWELGSGVVVDPSGILLTNEHVIRGGDDWWVVFPDGRAFGRDQVDVLGYNQQYDLAVLRVGDGSLRFPVAPLGDSSEIIVGEWAIAIGNPFGFYFRDSRPSVTVGVVSGLGREVAREVRSPGSTPIYKDMIQTDATINPGNSGGALANALGEVIGINTFVLAGASGSSGVGFAIPIHVAREVMDDILEFGQVREPYVGLYVYDLNPQIRRELGITRRYGIVVGRIDEGSPAEQAGFQIHDIIVSVDGRSVTNYSEAYRAIFGSKVGDELRFGIERFGHPMELRLALTERPTRGVPGAPSTPDDPATGEDR
jgi:serine protease Do